MEEGKGIRYKGRGEEEEEEEEKKERKGKERGVRRQKNEAGARGRGKT